MSLHWWHVVISYALTLGAFGALALGAVLRHRVARRRLSMLEQRPRRTKGRAA